MTPKMTNPAAGRACGAEDIYKNSGSILSISYDVVDQFRQAMYEAGIIYHGEIIADGSIHRGYVDGDKPGTKNLAYRLYSDNFPAGWFQNHRDRVIHKWRADTGRRLTRQELISIKAKIDEARRTRELEIHSKHEAAAAKAVHLWNCARPASESFPYLRRKNIPPCGARQLANAIVLPLHDESGRIVNLQFITPEGQKRFLSGGKKRGCFYLIGDLTERILICEGFATGASLYEATEEMTVIAFDCGNLLPVAQIIRRKYPDTEIVICGDNDINGVGQRAANEAALAVDGLIHIPDEIGCDWNDILAGGRHHD
ncbi:MAG: toprim domain-containing protein [Nitrosomonas sp.]|nr:toprim domain-containing protein [Nitrosomonas sp.]